MNTSSMLRKTVKALCEALCDTPERAPQMTDALLKLVEATALHEQSQQAGSPETVAAVHELQKQVKRLEERCNLLETACNIHKLSVR